MDFFGFEKPIHCRPELLIADALCVRLRRKNGWRVSRSFGVDYVPAFVIEALHKGQEHVINLLFGGHLIETGRPDDAAEKSILPFEVKLAASLGIVRFLAFEGPQVLVWLAAFVGLDSL